MPEYVYVDSRVLLVLMLLATGCVQYLLVGVVKAVLHWTRERKESKPRSPILLRGQEPNDTIVALKKAARK
jgi:hypothetical protein